MNLQTSRDYARVLRSELPPRIHEPATSRLLWLPVHVSIVALGIVALASGWVPLGLAWLVSLVLGLSFAGLTFVAHEALHGAIVRGRRAQNIVGTIGFLPFCISPRLWVAWHNRVHHGHTQEVGVDPDAFPTLDEYRKSKPMRIMIDVLGAKRGAPLGVLALLIGFSVQSTQVLVGAKRTKVLSAGQARLAMLETLVAAGLWLSVGFVFGWVPFVFGFVVPLMIANSIVMAHILTNHSLSPLTAVNDPLLNSLSVTLPRWAEWLSLGFGFHTEHHLYPWMSTRHAPAVRALIRARWPERYQSMPLLRAIWTIYSTPRVYSDDNTLFDSRTGQTWSTLAPHSVADGAIAATPVALLADSVVSTPIPESIPVVEPILPVVATARPAVSWRPSVGPSQG